MFDNINPQQNCQIMTDSTRKINFEQLQFTNLLKIATNIFQKPYQHRTASDLMKLNKIIQKVLIFKELQSLYSTQVIKSLFKYGRIVRVLQHNLISEENQSLDYFLIGLKGRFFTNKASILQQLQIPDQRFYQKYFQAFKNFTPKHLSYLKRKQQLSTNTFNPTKVDPLNYPIQNIQSSHLYKQIIFTPIQTYVNPLQIKRQDRNIITMDGQNYLFKIQFKKLCEILREQYNKEILKQTQIFLTFDSFKLFKKEKLKQFIEDVQLKSMKKNEILFRQGQKDDRIFILVKGEISLQKKALLGKQNPNTYYRNRLSIKRTQFKYKGGINVIPYADFSKVYNANHEGKNVRISIISPISILGEEQVICKGQRQNTAKISSLFAQFYVFTLEQLDKYITNDSNFQIEDFLKSLEQQITNKKILYRQQKLGNEVQNLNKHVNNGFYIEQSTVPVKVRKSVKRLNKTISCISPQIPIITEPHAQKDLFLTASYTTHNFQQFFETKKPQLVQFVQKIQQKVRKQRPRTHRIQYTNEEKQIFKFIHGNDKGFSQKSNKSNDSRSDKKIENFPINIQKPFFTPQYFKKQTQGYKRLEKDIKKSRLKSLYSSTLSMRSSPYKSKTLSNSRNLSNSISTVQRNFSYQF